MKTIQNIQLRFAEKRFILVLLLLAALECISIFFGTGRNDENEAVQKISELSGPAIDGGAAMTSAAVEICLQSVGSSFTMWMFALLITSMVVAINFIAALRTKNTVEWIPEVILLLPMLLLWYCLDRCYEAYWFPLTLVKINLILFALHLYLFEKRNTKIIGE